MSLKTKLENKLHDIIMLKIEELLGDLDPYDYLDQYGWSDLSQREMDQVFDKIQRFEEKISRLKF